MTLSPELAALRDLAMQTSCESWAIQCRWVLSRGRDRAGPCPNCGGTDRFSIQTVDNVFNCRRCGLKGAGVIELVMKTRQVGFVEACEIVTGRKADQPMDAAESARLRARAEADKQRQQAASEAYREKARKEAYAIWKRRLRFSDPQAAIAHDYLRRRAIDLDAVGADFDMVLGLIPDMPWAEAFTDAQGNDGWRTPHIGPALAAAITRPDGRFGGVHITWIDLGQPKGRLILPPDERGRARPTKKVRGTKKGGAIRLFTPPHPHRLVMGEGIETTGTPLCHAFEAGTAYWAGVDLGNMAGKALYVDGKAVHDRPDMDDLDVFLPPDWCEELVYLGEGDEAGVRSREKCIRGLWRAKTLREGRPELPPLRQRYVPPADGDKDMNDLAMADMAGDGAADGEAGRD